MKRSTIVCACLLGLTHGAFAADLPAPTLEYPEVRPLWGGAYVGFHAGYAWSDAHAELEAVEGMLLTLDVENGLFARETEETDGGFVGGAQIGYNVQVDRFVGGVEADVSYVDIDHGSQMSVVDPGPFFPGALTESAYETSIDWLATLRLRAGAALGGTLLYATGGAAAGSVENAFTIRVDDIGYTPDAWTEENTLYGYAVGGGVEQAVSSSLSVRLEYLYFDLEDQTVFASDPATFPGESIVYEFENDGHVVRAGLNLHF